MPAKNLQLKDMSFGFLSDGEFDSIVNEKKSETLDEQTLKSYRAMLNAMHEKSAGIRIPVGLAMELARGQATVMKNHFNKTHRTEIGLAPNESVEFRAKGKEKDSSIIVGRIIPFQDKKAVA